VESPPVPARSPGGASSDCLSGSSREGRVVGAPRDARDRWRPL
ncbi:MAG: hypothetical protein AVDCRST_MAG70-1700, partial [uncultured Thermomicrobiales bacterium]